MKIYLDTETCSFHSVAVTIQYAIENGPVEVYDIWTHPIQETLDLIEMFCENEIIGFNLSFDWFHICKLYTIFDLYPNKTHFPEFHIDDIAILEEQARFSNICLKPKSAFDVMLHARKTRYQSLMSRNDIRIRRIPTVLAWQLAEELEQRVKFDEIYFARAKDPDAPRWKVYDIKMPDGTINIDFKDVVLKFKASSGLKNLYRHAFNITEDVTRYADIEIDRKLFAFDFGWAPYALAVCPRFEKTRTWTTTLKIGGHKKRVTAWPGVLRHHIEHWQTNLQARKYAADDVIYTRRLYVEHFNSPPVGDNDSLLACMVAAARWRGYSVDLDEIQRLRDAAQIKVKSTPMAPAQAKAYVLAAMDTTERAVASIQKSTKRIILEETAKWLNDEGGLHLAAIRAREILDARQATKEIELYDKLLKAKRFHVAFKVTGALSSRMSGDAGLNAQGINHAKHIRKAFTLADSGVTTLNGGDFKGFEVSIAEKVFDDPVMHKDLVSGIKVHAIMGMQLFPGKTYEEIIASDGTKTPPDMYDIGKKGFFLKCYFGEAYTFHHKLGIDMEIAEQADKNFNRKYPKVKQFQDGIKADFCALTQPGGIGTKVEWRDPVEYSENIFGFRRYFMLENMVMKTLYQLAQNPPPSFKGVKVKVVRRERVQTAGGAVASALYGAAFGIQGANTRAGGNHKIQSVGAMILKRLQCAVWTLQPIGINPWIVQSFNAHDELMCPVACGHEPEVEKVVHAFVEDAKKDIPLLAIDWFVNIANWSEKKGAPLEGHES